MTATDCCNVPITQETQAGWCNRCEQDCCSHCAVTYEREDGYGDDGQEVRTKAICRECSE